jgi:hypothetical protein
MGDIVHTMDLRQEQRHPVEIQGRYRTGSGIPRDVIVTDLSEHGCRIFDRFCNLGIGRFITIRVGSIGPLGARVMWRESNLAGLQFSEPLHPRVLEHVLHTIEGWSPPS